MFILSPAGVLVCAQQQNLLVHTEHCCDENVHHVYWVMDVRHASINRNQSEDFIWSY